VSELIDAVPGDLRVVMCLGFTLLLVMLRLEASRFSTAEYDEPVRGRRPLILRQLAWYLLGVGGVLVLLLVHPSPEFSLHLTVGDRAGILLAIVLGVIGVGQAVGLAWLHYHRLRLPDIGAYPGALANEILTAFIDEAVFRGALLGYLLWAGAPPNLAIVGQAVIYVLTTRLGAPGRDKYRFAVAGMTGLIGGWATILTGGIGASFLAHASTRVAIFLTTGHAGQPPARGTEVEDVERRRRTPEGWRAVDRSGARER
jgi:membrane protease YdiL (CAAX protease family)